MEKWPSTRELPWAEQRRTGLPPLAPVSVHSTWPFTVQLRPACTVSSATSRRLGGLPSPPPPRYTPTPGAEAFFSASSPATSTHQVMPSLVFLSCSAKPSTQTLTRFGYLMPANFEPFAKVIGVHVSIDFRQHPAFQSMTMMMMMDCWLFS